MKKFMAKLMAILNLVTGSAMGDALALRQGSDETACDDDGQCVIFEVTVKLNVTHSAPLLRESTGVIVINNTSNPFSSSVRRQADTCTKQVRVPREVFAAIIGMMSTLSSEAEQPPALTPAQQTMLLFYTTMMQQTLQFQCDARDLAPPTQPSPSTPN